MQRRREYRFYVCNEVFRDQNERSFNGELNHALRIIGRQRSDLTGPWTDLVLAELDRMASTYFPTSVAEVRLTYDSIVPPTTESPPTVDASSPYCFAAVVFDCDMYDFNDHDPHEVFASFARCVWRSHVTFLFATTADNDASNEVERIKASARVCMGATPTFSCSKHASYVSLKIWNAKPVLMSLAEPRP
jgi:hypothetical protein